MARPLIGITTYREQARWGIWHVPAVLLPAAYADAVADGRRRAGAAADRRAQRRRGRPAGRPGARRRGGRRPGAVRRARSGRTRPSSGRSGTRASSSSSRPRSTATCRCSPSAGACSCSTSRSAATWCSTSPTLERTGVHDPGPGLYQRREVRTEPDTEPSPAAGCRGDRGLPPPPGPGAGSRPELTASAWAEDGVVEAVEAGDGRFCLAVQWHPEETRTAGCSPRRSQRRFLQALQQPLSALVERIARVLLCAS